MHYMLNEIVDLHPTSIVVIAEGAVIRRLPLPVIDRRAYHSEGLPSKGCGPFALDNQLVRPAKSLRSQHGERGNF